MQKKLKKYLIITGGLFLIFILFTVMVKTVDVQPVGPDRSKVGFASVNQCVFRFFGVNLLWYDITDWLGVFAIVFALGFAALGLFQLIKRRSIQKVDCRILLLGVFYVMVIAVYMFFEVVVVNNRPIILSESLEAFVSLLPCYVCKLYYGYSHAAVSLLSARKESLALDVGYCIRPHYYSNCNRAAYIRCPLVY